jgi:predicted nucleic acid-binding protein
LEKDLVAADWILTEFASALFVKARRGDLAQKYAKIACEDFENFCRGGLRLIPVTRTAFTRGADLIRNAEGALRAGDALHLAMALEVGVSGVATADERFEQNATAHGLSVTRF